MSIYNINSVDTLIEIRKQSRLDKDYKLSDEIRDYLDSKLVFIFDTKDAQDVYYLNENMFGKVKDVNKRKYIEQLIKRGIIANNNFESWLFSVRKSAKLI